MARERRARGAAESLGSVVLGFESIVVFLGGLAIYGLKALPATMAPWWGIVAGTVLAAALIGVSGMLHKSWGFAAGWACQIVLVLGAFIVPALGVVALIFGGMYGYATIKGKALDARNAQRRA